MVYRAKDGIWGIWVIHGICRCLIKSMTLHSPCRVCVCVLRVLYTPSTQCLCTHCNAVVKLCTLTQSLHVLINMYAFFMAIYDAIRNIALR